MEQFLYYVSSSSLRGSGLKPLELNLNPYPAPVSSSSLRGSGLKPHVYGFRIRLGSFFLLFEGNLGIKCLKFCS
ncbi:hypothetical protein [Leptospira kirschneri]